MTESGLQHSDTIMIGGRKHDILGAQSNEIESIGVTWGYGSRDELEAAGAGYVVSSWDDLVTLVTRQ